MRIQNNSQLHPALHRRSQPFMEVVLGDYAFRKTSEVNWVYRFSLF